jgi:DNA-binding CsgD family transcriptional regulator
MDALRERDVRSALELVYDAASIDGPDPFPDEFFVRLSALIPVDVLAGYHEVIVGRPCTVVESTEIGSSLPPQIQAAGRRHHAQDPLNHKRKREWRALRLTDFYTVGQLRKLEMYQYVWRPMRIEDSLRMWLPAPAGRARMLYLERSSPFTERDRSLLELLRPSLIRMHAAASARRRATAAPATTLTRREHEILSFVAEGKTSREIAASLVVSPHTVRKHVENILEKLGVPTRSAAVARVFGRAEDGAGALNGTG